MYFETGADCLRGMMSPGNIVSGHVVSGADCLRGMLSPGAGCLRGRLSPGRIFSGADCLRAYFFQGTLSPGQIVLGHIVSGYIVSGRMVSGHHVPPPNFFHYSRYFPTKRDQLWIVMQTWGHWWFKNCKKIVIYPKMSTIFLIIVRNQCLHACSFFRVCKTDRYNLDLT